MGPPQQPSSPPGGVLSLAQKARQAYERNSSASAAGPGNGTFTRSSVGGNTGGMISRLTATASRLSGARVSQQQQQQQQQQPQPQQQPGRLSAVGGSAAAAAAAAGGGGSVAMRANAFAALAASGGNSNSPQPKPPQRVFSGGNISSSNSSNNSLNITARSPTPTATPKSPVDSLISNSSSGNNSNSSNNTSGSESTTPVPEPLHTSDSSAQSANVTLKESPSILYEIDPNERARPPSPVTMSIIGTLSRRHQITSNRFSAGGVSMLDPHQQSMINTAAQDAVELAKFKEKRWVWIPDERKGYLRGHIIEDLDINKGLVRVRLDDSGQDIDINMCELQDVNPPKFDGKEDMAQLAYLNEASVIHNLRLRYENKSQIYTYSGLFLVAVNPYRELPIYTDKVVKLYMSHGGGNYSSNLHQLGQSEEMKKKPHVFAVADKAYHAMLKQRTDQSVLITGESGAGKTENTKKVIQFLIAVASDVRYRSTTSSTSNGSNSSININSNSNNNNNSYHTLESQILSANPILEAFGNAQTLRNNNSSRFGKFIRIIFNTSGQIAGSYINWYLLEKSRVTHPNKHERNYHVFYQLLKGASDDIKDALLLKDTELSDYQFTRGTPSSIDGVSDESEYAMLTHSMNIMNFTAKKQLDFLRVVAAILHLGNVTFSGNKPTEQANIADISSIHRICHVLGIANAQDFMKALLAPRILAGRQWVTRAQTTEQAKYALEALARSLYERMFGRLVDSINESINKHQNHYINGNTISSNMSNSYIGVLDIAGFEIFTVNTFEQLCINYTNEKLQQFFNHHMFMLEQQEYKREDIEWTDIDFGLDLQPTIDLIESSHPLVGILASLDDQSLMQRSTDANFTEDLHRNWRDHPSQVYRPRRFKMGFVVKHYASEVKYDTHGWLNKNRDPLNESVTRVLASSRESFIAGLFSEYSDDNLDNGPASSTNADLFAFQSQPSNASGNNRLSLGGRGPKAGSFRTVAQRHKEQLTALMARLHTTEPHFVRCIVPNEYKRPGIIDTLLVLNQLRCNGVLEGIRIYRQGFPNRLTFDEFTRQYSILAGPSKSKNKKRSAYEYIEPRQAAEQLLRELAIDTGRYRIGRTKVFFRAGVHAELEEMFEQVMYDRMSAIASLARGYLARRRVMMMRGQSTSVTTVQRNARLYLQLKRWSWWDLFVNVKPLLSTKASVSEAVKEKERQLKQLQDKITEDETERTRLQSANDGLLAERERWREAYESEHGAVSEQAEQLQRAQVRQAAMEESLAEHRTELERLETQIQSLEDECERLRNELASAQNTIAHDTSEVTRLQDSAHNLDSRVRELQQQLDEQRAAYEALEVERHASEARATQSAAQVASLEESNAVLRNRLDAMQATIADHETQLKRAVDERQSLHSLKSTADSELRQLRSELSAALKAKEDADQQSAKLASERSLLAAKLETESGERERTDKSARELAMKMDSLSADLAAAKADTERAISQRTALESELAQTRQLVDDKADAESEQRELARMRDAEIAQLRQQLEEAHSQADAVRRNHLNEMETVRSELEDIRHENELMHRERNEMETAVRDAGAASNELQGRLHQAEERARGLESDAAAANDRLGEMTRTLDTVEQGKIAAEKKLADTVQELLVKNEANSVLTAEKNAIEQQRLALIDEVTDLKRSLQSATDSSHSLTVERDEMAARVKHSDVILTVAHSDIASLNAELDELRARYDDVAVRENNELKQAISALEDQVSSLNATLEANEEQRLNADKLRSKAVTDAENLQYQVNELRAACQEHESRATAVQHEIQRHKDKIDEVQKLRAQRDAQLRKHQNENNALMMKFAEMQRHVEMLQAGKTSLENELTDLLQRLGDGTRNVHTLEQSVKRLNARETDLLAQVNDEAERRQQCEMALLDSQAALEQMMADVAAERDQAAKQMDEVRGELLDQVNLMGERLDRELMEKTELLDIKTRLEQEMATMMSSIDTATRSHSSSEEARSKVEQQLQSVQQQLEEERQQRVGFEELAERHERRTNELQQQFEQLETRYTDLNASHNDLERLYAESREELAIQQGALGRLDDILQSRDREIEELRDSLSAANTQLESLEQQHRKGYSELESARSVIQQEMGELSAALQAANRDIESKRAAVTERDQTLSRLQRDLDAERQQLATVALRCNQFEEQLAAANQMLEDSVIRLETEVVRTTELERDLELIQSQRDQAAADSARATLLQQRLAKLEQSSRFADQSARDQVSQLIEQRDFAEKQVRDLERQLMEHRDIIEERAVADSDNAYLRERLEQALAALDNLRREAEAGGEMSISAMRDTYQRQLEDTVKDLEAERGHVLALRESQIVLDNCVADLNDKVEAMRRENTVLASEKVRLQEKIDELNARLDQTSSSNRAWIPSIPQLERNNRELQAKLDESEVKRELLERTRANLQQSLDHIQQQLDDIMKDRATIERSSSETAKELARVRDQAAQHRSEAEAATAKQRRTEDLLRDAHQALDMERRTVMELTNSKAALEKQINEQRVRLVDFEAGSIVEQAHSVTQRLANLPQFGSIGPGGSIRGSPSGIFDRLDNDIRERSDLLRTNRRLERTLKEHEAKLTDLTKQRARLDEEGKRDKQRVARLKEQVTQLEANELELQGLLSRAQNEANAYKEKAQRLDREIALIKGRIGAAAAAAAATTSNGGGLGGGSIIGIPGMQQQQHQQHQQQQGSPGGSPRFQASHQR